MTMVDSVMVPACKVKAIAEKTILAVQQCRAKRWKEHIQKYRNGIWFKRFRKTLTDKEIQGIIRSNPWDRMISPDSYYRYSQLIAEQLLDLCKISPPLGYIEITAESVKHLVID